MSDFFKRFEFQKMETSRLNNDFLPGFHIQSVLRVVVSARPVYANVLPDKVIASMLELANTVAKVLQHITSHIRK